ncbi:hypothetical protein BJ912DRAFT_959316 [Pholiota molesta]|nr:hypothetical protein BJ912DRAFT_972982 [Pholiota molesta]KAF8194094.1 hypothetical protein BJ912DRAFT_959316 [Pholiota molesta]
MHFNTPFTSLALALTFALSANADTIVAFSTNTCSGDIGNTVQCDGSCHLFTGRHSLLINGGSTHCVTYFLDNTCNFADGSGGTNLIPSNSCHPVNTGGPVNSFLCAPTTSCLAAPP